MVDLWSNRCQVWVRFGSIQSRCGSFCGRLGVDLGPAHFCYELRICRVSRFWGRPFHVGTLGRPSRFRPLMVGLSGDADITTPAGGSRRLFMKGCTRIFSCAGRRFGFSWVSACTRCPRVCMSWGHALRCATVVPIQARSDFMVGPDWDETSSTRTWSVPRQVWLTLTNFGKKMVHHVNLDRIRATPARLRANVRRCWRSSARTWSRSSSDCGSNVVRFRAEFWRIRAKCLADVSHRIWHLHWANIGRHRVKFSRHRPKSESEFGLSRGECGRTWSISAQHRPTSTDIDRHRRTFGRFWNEWEDLKAVTNLAAFGRGSTEFERCRPHAGANFGYGKIGAMLTGAAPIWATLGLHPENLQGPRPGTTVAKHRVERHAPAESSIVQPKSRTPCSPSQVAATRKCSPSQERRQLRTATRSALACPHGLLAFTSASPRHVGGAHGRPTRCIVWAIRSVFLLLPRDLAVISCHVVHIILACRQHVCGMHANASYGLSTHVPHHTQAYPAAAVPRVTLSLTRPKGRFCRRCGASRQPAKSSLVGALPGAGPGAA